ncbi:unnamed protein product [Darwinula stevensoni]|uniref:L-fucose mutarotase n=1 Tax=Darwinula stevensoni TaxID=69355 RepID=A0A7R8WZW6_9CRUS|nr:unnamed protein product [Darwinula stevensoni]CAG0880582.1 unnamed protein product [Darwinula stevensoni]
MHLRSLELVRVLRRGDKESSKFSPRPKEYEAGCAPILADANFPTSSICKRGGGKELRADGHPIPPLLDAILQLMPLDVYHHPVAVMEPVEAGLKVEIWQEYEDVIERHHGKRLDLERVERFAFYERARQAYAVIHTGETASYGNIILKMGVISD